METDNIKGLFTGNEWTEWFTNLENYITDLKNADTQNISTDFGKKPCMGIADMRKFILKKLQSLELVPAATTPTPTSAVKLTDIITIDNDSFDGIDVLKFKKSIQPKVIDDLMVPNMQPSGKDIFKKVVHDASHQALGGEGLWDDNAWSVNEKGGIYMSAHPGKSYYMHEDGTLKLGIKVNKDNETLADYIRKTIWELKLQ